MNAQIRKNRNNGYSFHNTSNRNGQHLTEFMIENRLTCVNTNYQKREGKLWTYTYANNSKAQIDYVLINKKWKNSMMNCEAYSSFEGVSSNHQIVTAKIRLSVVFWPFDPAKNAIPRWCTGRRWTHSNGSYEKKSRGRKLADEMGRAKKFPYNTHRLMHRKRVTCELHDSYFRLMTIKHSISKIEWASNYYIIQLSSGSSASCSRVGEMRCGR